LIKSRRESIELYKQGGRQDLVDKEETEIGIIEQFLPKQMNEEETRAVVRDLVASLGATSVKDMGKVMAAIKSKYAGQLDIAKASAAVKDLLMGK
ncbi:MAG: GatB/YqeY domain-containing protein, partial [Rhodomicrobium sp.]